jgi:hypothetical protein
VDDSEGKTICLPVNSFGDERKATAHLIAAAPELYEALLEAQHYMQDCGCRMSEYPEIEQALRKARG